jgi:hypothetical protein
VGGGKKPNGGKARARVATSSTGVPPVASFPEERVSKQASSATLEVPPAPASTDKALEIVAAETPAGVKREVPVPEAKGDLTLLLQSSILFNILIPQTS